MVLWKPTIFWNGVFCRRNGVISHRNGVFFWVNFVDLFGHWMRPCPIELRSLALLQNCFNSIHLAIRWTSTIGKQYAWFNMIQKFCMKRLEDSQATDSIRSSKFAARNKGIDFLHTRSVLDFGLPSALNGFWKWKPGGIFLGAVQFGHLKP